MKSYSKFIIKESVDWNEKLRNATWSKNIDLEGLKIAVQNGADVDSCGTLSWAVRHDNLDVVKYMLKNNANVNYQDNDCKWAPLMTASDDGFVDIAKILIDYNADPLIGNFQNINTLDILRPNSDIKNSSFSYESSSKKLKLQRDKIFNYLINRVINNTPELLYKYVKYLTKEQKEKYKKDIDISINLNKYNL
jgi:hypothetical protein